MQDRVKRAPGNLAGIFDRFVQQDGNRLILRAAVFPHQATDGDQVGDVWHRLVLAPLTYLDREVLLKTSSRKVCMTCHWFRHHAGVNCIPVLTCQLNQGLIAHGEHLTSRCQGWTDDMTRSQGWAPEVA